MPSNANVFIHYGPYNSNGIVTHREDRLQGLKTYLEAKGHVVKELVKSKLWNDVIIYVNNEQVFKMNIASLEFGGDGELDRIVQDCESAITKAY